MVRLALALLPVALAHYELYDLPDPDIGIPGVLEKWYSETLGSAENAHLHVEGKLPEWLVGSMFNAGPSQQKLGQETFNHIFDGFARTNRFDFDGSKNSIVLNSKMMDTKWYNESTKAGRIFPSTLMAETIPPRPSSKFPLANILGPNDNIYVMPWKIGDDYLYLTDGETRLRFDPDSLNIVEEITYSQYKGDAEPEGMMCGAGSAHVVPDPRADGDGSFIGMMGCSPTLPWGTQAMVVFRMNAGDVHTRHKIAQIDQTPYSYMHSFSITKNYVILIGEPYHIDVNKMAMGATMSEAFWYNISLGTTFFVVDIDTGNVQPLKTDGFLFIHTMNAFEKDKDTIVLDVDGVGDKGYLQEGVKSVLFNKTFRDGSMTKRLVRYTLHLDTGIVESADACPGLGATTTIVPRFNEKMRGSEACFGYAPGFRYNSSSFDSAAAVKMDLCKGTLAAFYYAFGHFHSELIFVPRPGAVEEDDGVLLGVVYDGVSQQSYMNVLDAKTMEQVAKAYTPFKLPFVLHANFYPKAASSMPGRTIV